jgi:hypothetical protein
MGSFANEDLCEVESIRVLIARVSSRAVSTHSHSGIFVSIMRGRISGLVCRQVGKLDSPNLPTVNVTRDYD